MNVKLIMFSIFALAASAAMPASAEKGGDAAAGKAVFAAKCVACHAKDGKGNAKMAQMYKLDPIKLDLLSEETRKMTAAEQAKSVADGKEKMKGFKGKLSEADIANVVAYVRSLGEGPAAK